MPAALFTDESPFTLDNTDADKFRRIVRKPNNAESLRPGKAPHKGSQKGEFRMTIDPRFQSTRGILRFSRKVKP